MGCHGSKAAADPEGQRNDVLLDQEKQDDAVLGVGSFVQLNGLQSIFFNGLTGRVATCKDDNDRVQVKLCLPPGRTIAVKVRHLCKAAATSAAVLMFDAGREGAGAHIETAAADALKKEFRQTDEQQKAAAIVKRVSDSAGAFYESKAHDYFALDGPNYKDFLYYSGCSGGKLMEPLLNHTTLIDAHYLIALGEANGTLPRAQELPEAARIGKHNVWRLRLFNRTAMLPVLVWSYCWYSKEHPDPKGEQLRKVVPILKIMVKEAKCFNEHCTIAVLQDYGSYPQWPRSPDEKTSFSLGLKQELNKWYAHPNTIVLMIDLPASTCPEHTNYRLYDERGWCFTEKQLSTITKYAYCFWRMSLFKDAECWNTLRTQLSTQRPVPIAPPSFAAALREAVDGGELSFTSPADLDLVINIYEKGFAHAVKSITADNQIIYWWQLGWADGDAPTLINTIKYMKPLLDVGQSGSIFLSGNNFTLDTQQQLLALADSDWTIDLD